MKNKNDLVKEWFQKADNDILSIENNLMAEKIPTDVVCFHAQQAVEKYLKGYLIYYNIEFEFVHNLIYLNNLAIKHDNEFEKLKEISKKLNEYAVIPRYPYFYTPTLEEAKEAYKMALKVKEFVLSKVKL